MSFRISLDGQFDPSVSADLRELAENLADNGLAVTTNTLVVPGVKVDLVIGLAIASLAVSSVGTLVAVLDFWQKQKGESYVVSVELQGEISELGDGTDQVLEKVMEEGKSLNLIIKKR